MSDSRRVRVCCALATILGVIAAPALAAPPPAGAPPVSAQQALAQVPPHLLRELPPATMEALASGVLTGHELLASLGRAPVVRGLTPPEAQVKAFILHWMYNYTCLVAGINEDLVGESSIDGRCSGQPMTSTAGAPSPSPSYRTSSDGSVYTGYWNAPSDSVTCTTTNFNLTRYYITWVWAATARSAHAFFGAADYYKLWINGDLVMSRTSGGMKPWSVDEYSAPVTLVQGWNLIVLKHSFPQLGPYVSGGDPNLHYKYFSLRFATDAAGSPMTDLIAADDPGCPDDASGHAVYSRSHVANLAHITGVGGAQWRTDITLANNTYSRWQYWLRYYREGNNSGVPDSEKLVELAPFESRTWFDAIPTLFGRRGDQKGYYVVLQASYQFLVGLPYGYGALQTKVYNQSSAGTYGMSIPARYIYESSGWSGVFYGVRNGQYRTNLGLMPMINVGATCRVKVWLFDPAVGLAVSKEYSGITGYWQLNNVFADLGVGSVVTDNATMYYQLQENPTNTYWIAYVTANDGNPATGSAGTSDPVYQQANYIFAYPELP